MFRLQRLQHQFGNVQTDLNLGWPIKHLLIMNQLHLSFKVVPNFASNLPLRVRSCCLHLYLQRVRIDWPLELVFVDIEFVVNEPRKRFKLNIGMVPTQVSNHAGSIATFSFDDPVAKIAGCIGEVLKKSNIGICTSQVNPKVLHVGHVVSYSSSIHLFINIIEVIVDLGTEAVKGGRSS